MAERKTAEIKLRIEPSVKAQWQQSAADEGIGLSEFICKCITEYLLSRRESVKSFPPPAYLPLAPANDRICDDGYACLAPDCSCPKDSVPTSEVPEKFGSDWKPWG